MQITVKPDGDLTFLDHEELAPLKDLGIATTRRASHIEPVSPLLRWIFHQIRSRVADKSRLAACTRLWPCLWRANLALSEGPVLGPFRTRTAALEAEVRWLEK